MATFHDAGDKLRFAVSASSAVAKERAAYVDAATMAKFAREGFTYLGHAPLSRFPHEVKTVRWRKEAAFSTGAAAAGGVAANGVAASDGTATTTSSAAPSGSAASVAGDPASHGHPVAPGPGTGDSNEAAVNSTAASDGTAPAHPSSAVGSHVVLESGTQQQPGGISPSGTTVPSAAVTPRFGVSAVNRILGRMLAPAPAGTTMGGTAVATDAGLQPYFDAAAALNSISSYAKPSSPADLVQVEVLRGDRAGNVFYKS